MATIRPATLKDLVRIQAIEVAAGEAFCGYDMAEIAEHDPPSIEMLAGHVESGTIWVAVDGNDAPVAYLVADVFGDLVHIEQVTVHPEAARGGIGRSLIDHLEVWARNRGLRAITLTTFRDIPWNAPYYARLGFEMMADVDLPIALREIVALESALGLDRWPRVVMKRVIG